MAPTINIIEKQEIEDTSVQIDDIVLIPGDPMESSDDLPPLSIGPSRPYEVDQGFLIDPLQQLSEENIGPSDSIEIDTYNNETDATNSTTVDPGNSIDENLNTNDGSEKGEVNSSNDAVQNSTDNENFDDDSYLKVIPLTVPSSKY